MMLNTDNTVLVLIDVQEKLMRVMHDQEPLIDALTRLVRAMQALGIPVLPLRQTPDKMGPIVAPLRDLLGPTAPIDKQCFSCCGAEAFREALERSGRRQVLLAGIEAHVCVYQTAVHLIREGYAAEVVVDAVSSRRPSDKAIGIEKIRACGAHSVGSGQGHVTTVETAVFELLQSAEHPAFRDILKLVK